MKKANVQVFISIGCGFFLMFFNIVKSENTLYGSLLSQGYNYSINSQILKYQENPLLLLKVNESQVLIKAESLQVFSLSNDGGISNQEVQENLLTPNPDSQPTFIDIVFLQIKIISSLIQSIQDIQQVPFDQYFQTNNDYQYYLNWIDRISKYYNKDEFINALSGGVSIKDIGIANDIIYGLSSRMLCYLKSDLNCQNIKISITKKGDYIFYNLEEILDKIYSNFSTKTVGENYLSIYENILNLSGTYNSFSGENSVFLKGFLSKLFSNDINSFDLDDYDIGYGLQIRINNLKSLKSGFLNKTQQNKINLLGIHNFYTELNNITKGLKKTIELKSAISSGNIDNFKQTVASIDLQELISIKQDNLFEIPEGMAQMSFIYSGEQNHLSGNTIIKIGLGGDYYLGYPQANISINGKIYQQGIEVSETVLQTKSGFPQIQMIQLENSIDKIESIKVSFINDAVGNGPNSDRNLYVSYVQVNNRFYYPKDAKIYRTDGYSIPDFRNNNYLQRNGELMFNIKEMNFHDKPESINSYDYKIVSNTFTIYRPIISLMNGVLKKYFGSINQFYIKGSFIEGNSTNSGYLNYNEKQIYIQNCIIYGGGLVYQKSLNGIIIYFDATKTVQNFPEYCGKVFR